MSVIIKTGSTWAPTGGVDLTFTSDGRSVPDGVSLVCTADSNLLTRRSLRMRSIMPAMAVRAGDSAKLGRQTATLYVPFLASDGKLYLQPQKIELAFHPEYLAADKATRRVDLASMLIDSDLTPFWDSAILPY